MSILNLGINCINKDQITATFSHKNSTMDTQTIVLLCFMRYVTTSSEEGQQQEIS